MADGYDRFDSEGNNGGGSFVMGLLTGTVLGAGLGMLFAPKAGSELRNQLSEQAGNLANQAQDGVRKVTENAGEWADRGRDMYGKAKDAVVKGADDAQQYVRDNAGAAKDAAAKGMDEAQKYVRDTANSMKDTAASAMPSTAGAGGSTGSSGSSGSSFGSGSSYGGNSESMRGGGQDQNRPNQPGGSTPGSTPGSPTGGTRRS
jgi:gas vesicle protein